MGVTDIPAEKKETFAQLLKKIDSISAREQEMIPILKKYTNKPISVHIDPTFLQSKEDWKKFEKPYNIKKPYFLVYPIYWDIKFNKELRKLHKKTGLNIVVLSSGLNKVYANKRVFDASPGQFLWLIDNAEAVISSSFHGIAFSIIFNKKFAPVINPCANSRIENLLKILNVPHQEISKILDFDVHQYAYINSAIKFEKEKSFTYLAQELIDE